MYSETHLTPGKLSYVTGRDFAMQFRPRNEEFSTAEGVFCRVIIPFGENYVIKGDTGVAGSRNGIATEAIIRSDVYDQEIAVSDQLGFEFLGTPISMSQLVIKVPFANGRELEEVANRLKGSGIEERCCQTLALQLSKELSHLEVHGWAFQELTGTEFSPDPLQCIRKFPYRIGENYTLVPVDLSSAIRIPTRSDLQKYQIALKFAQAVHEGPQAVARLGTETSHMNMPNVRRLFPGVFDFYVSLQSIYETNKPIDTDTSVGFLEKLFTVLDSLDSSVTDARINIGNRQFDINNIGNHTSFRNRNQTTRQALYASARISQNFPAFLEALKIRMDFIQRSRNQLLQDQERQKVRLLDMLKKYLNMQ